ncbi:MazG-like family protein [Streptomyces sp. MK7]|uniref:MazG-like family protein n=1 Tax=Streptomyces sp. MK7 TaxID=3067635 RepID=UPI0029300DB5|nr:MazG-like family protein [Streptomyces sp. MK7]
MSDQDTTATPVAAPADLWTSIDALWTWLDAHGPYGGREGLLLRMLKLSEEVGEAAQAVIGVMGQNPRKGTTHTWEDVQSELCDVVITALVALRTLTPDAREVFDRHLARVRERSLGAAGAPGGQAGPASE